MYHQFFIGHVPIDEIHPNTWKFIYEPIFDSFEKDNDKTLNLIINRRYMISRFISCHEVSTSFPVPLAEMLNILLHKSKMV